MWANAQLDIHPCGIVPTMKCLWIGSPGKPTARIKHWVTSCHTAEFISIWMFTCLAYAPRNNCGWKWHNCCL